MASYLECESSVFAGSGSLEAFAFTQLTNIDVFVHSKGLEEWITAPFESQFTEKANFIAHNILLDFRKFYKPKEALNGHTPPSPLARSFACKLSTLLKNVQVTRRLL